MKIILIFIGIIFLMVIIIGLLPSFNGTLEDKVFNISVFTKNY